MGSKLSTRARHSVVAAAPVFLALTWLVVRGERQPTAAEIDAGNVLFLHEWTLHDPLCGEGDGLGPVFNANSCVECQSLGGIGGGGGIESNVLTFEAAPTLKRPYLVNHVIHHDAIAAEYLETKQTASIEFSPIVGVIQMVPSTYCSGSV